MKTKISDSTTTDDSSGQINQGTSTTYDSSYQKLYSYDLDDLKEACLHENCSQCHGTGKKADGSFCIHNISCPCPKCSPRW